MSACLQLNSADGFRDASNSSISQAASSSRIFSLFHERAAQIAAQKLDRRLLSRVDHDDIVQSAFRSLFSRLAHNLYTVRSMDDLWGLLVVITTRKCSRQASEHFAQRRDVRRSQTIADSLVETIHDHCDAGEFDSLHLEAIDRLLQSITENERDVLLRILFGEPVEQIARALGRTQRTVRRMLANVRSVIETMRVE